MNSKQKRRLTHSGENFNIDKQKLKLEAIDHKYQEDALFKHLKLLFLQTFNDHKINLEENFKGDVWFLKNSPNFEKLTDNNITVEGPYTEFQKILEDTSINKNNFAKLKINVKTFINEICKNILEANERMINAKEMMTH